MSPHQNASLSMEDRFWMKVDTSGDCWEWAASRNGDGYGEFWVSPSNRKAHRVSYEMANGPIAAGLDIDHVCHNRACVKPEHLRLVTRSQNLQNRSGSQPRTTSGIRGVSWNKDRKKWSAQVVHENRKIHLGLFVTIAEAQEAAKSKRLELFTHNDLDRKEAA